MRLIALVVLVLCSSLAIADVVQISDDTFVIRRSDKGGFLETPPK